MFFSKITNSSNYLQLSTYKGFSTFTQPQFKYRNNIKGRISCFCVKAFGLGYDVSEWHKDNKIRKTSTGIVATTCTLENTSKMNK